MGKRSPPSTCESKSQSTMFNFFSKKEKQQSKLFTHTTRPRGTRPASVLTKQSSGGKKFGAESCGSKPLRREHGTKGSVPTKQLVGVKGAGYGDEETGPTGRQSQKRASNVQNPLQGTGLGGGKSLTPRRKEIPITVIPETPESCMVRSGRNVDVKTIAETPPSNLTSKPEEDELLNELLKENKPTLKRSKLSRKFGRQSKTHPTASWSSGENGLSEIEPTGKLSSDLGQSKGYKASHERGDLLTKYPESETITEADMNSSRRNPSKSGVGKSQSRPTTGDRNIVDSVEDVDFISDGGTQTGIMESILEDDDILNELLRENKSVFKRSKLSRKPSSLAMPFRNENQLVDTADVITDRYYGILNKEMLMTFESGKIISSDPNLILTTKGENHENFMESTHTDMHIKSITKAPPSILASDSEEDELRKLLGVNEAKLPQKTRHQNEPCVTKNSSMVAEKEPEIAGAPLGPLNSDSLEDEILSELSRTTHPARTKSKLSLKSRRQDKPCPTKKPSVNTGEDPMEIKPTKILGKKFNTKTNRVSSHKRSPQRGNSPYAKRPQKCGSDEVDSGPAKKHLFEEGDTIPPSEFTRSGRNTVVSSILEENLEGDNFPPAPKGVLSLVLEQKAVLSDMTNTCGNRSMDVEWDDLNESLLAALDEEDLLAQSGNTPLTTISTSSVPGRPDVPNFGHSSPFKKDHESTLPPDLVRFRVQSVEDCHNGDKRLRVQNLSTAAATQACSLSGVWSQLSYTEGDILAIHGQWSDTGLCSISQNEGFIIYRPDLLLTGTAVSNSIRCMRRSVLNELFKGIDKGNKAMVLGTMVHEVFGKALRTRKFDESSLQKYATLSLADASFRDKLYSMQLKEAEVLKDIGEYYKPLQTWANKYLRQSPSPQSMVDIKWPGTTSSMKSQVSIPRVADIEDNIWSPRWGLKGKVDVTTDVKIKRSSRAQRPDTYTLPLELKTGRQTNSMEHHSQVMLYSLMMTDLDPQGPPLGLLLYLKTGALLSVTASHMDKRELVHLRNQLAFYLTREAGVISNGLLPPELPPPIEDDFTCGRCAHATSCAIINRVRPSGGMSESATAFFDEQLNHLSEVHLQYFTHWYALLALENKEIRRKNPTNHIWNKPVQERELKGGCSGNLIVENSQQESTGRFSVTFNQRDRSMPIKFVIGDWVVVSEDGKRTFAKLIGTVTSVSASSVTISTDSPLTAYPTNRATYTMDTNESYNSMASSYNNLAGLMSSTAHMSSLRSVIVDLNSPKYGTDGRSDLSLSAEAEKILQGLNEDQQSAIMKVLKSHDYTLIMGMPGTGKTTTVTALVHILVLEGKSVLLTSYTHSAVDNILLKLNKVGVSFLRLGSSYRIRQELLTQSEGTALKGMNVDQVTSVIESTPVIAATSLGVKSSLLTHKHFDFCIIDEASQISQPVCLAPLFRATKFVLVGDHKQLPPLIQSPQARLHGMSESLFQRLASAHQESVTKLRLQYRMHPLIMEISNEFTYEGALQCGNHLEQSKLLELPQFTGRNDTSWQQKALDPETVVQLFSTEKLPVEDSGSGQNVVEANLVRDTVSQLIQSGCPATDIGIITPYNKQRRLLETLVAPLSADIEVNTVDKYQGRDKTVIILSFTMQKQSGPSILEDERRINVAITRAKKKLLMFGNCAVLSSIKSIGRLIRIMEDKKLVSIIGEP